MDEPKTNEGVGAAANSPRPGAAGFIGLVKDYGGAIVAIVGIVSTISGAIAWAYAYFATQEQVTRLECAMSANILVQSLPTAIAHNDLQIRVYGGDLVEFKQRKTAFDAKEAQKLQSDIDKFTSANKSLNDQYDAALKQQRDCIAIKKSEKK